MHTRVTTGEATVGAQPTAAGTGPRTTERSTSTRNVFRPDIQGLRAIAVGVVVLYHLWPTRLRGGYIGVDVFFVISGFLMTNHLWREAQTLGTISLTRFYARRGLRLLPAAILVLICTAVASLLFLPDNRWGNTFQQLIASAAYVENWLLARNSVDYLLQFAPDSPVQHFWSLSVEEQFYAIWPVVILATVCTMTRIRRNAPLVIRRRAVVVSLSTLLVASLAFSMYDTATSPKQAYFVTPTRVWEFAVGGLCALLAVDWATWSRVLLGWLGVVGIVVASFFYVKATPFPGYAALLPVVGAAAVIMGAQSRSPWSASWWLSLRPMTVVGDISYAIYLWHWPMLLLVPLALNRSLTLQLKLVILAATLVVSWLSTHLMETPLRRSRYLKTRRWPSLAFATAGVAAMVGAAVLASSIFEARVEAATARFTTTVAPGACHGAAVFDKDAHCGSVFGDGPIMAPALAVKDQSNKEYTRCDSWLDTREVHQCAFGPDDAPVRVAIVGDSHAEQWLGAIELLAAQGRWRAKTYFKSSCMFADAVRVIPSEPKQWQQNCTDWQKDVIARVVADTSIDYVIVAAFGSAYTIIPADGAPAKPTTMEDAFRSMWRKVTDSGKKVVVIRDTPSTSSLSIPECVERNMDNFHACSLPREKALTPDPVAGFAVNAGDPNIVMIDLSDGICDSSWCYGIAGNVIVYRDTNHLTWQYAESLAPRLWSEFTAATTR